MTGIVARSSCASYLVSNTNQFISQGNYFFWMFDDGVFKLGQHSADLGRQISKVKDNEDAAAKFGYVANGFGAARSVIGAVRFVPAFHKLLTGQIFYSQGWRRVEHNAGKPVTIPKDELATNWRWVEQDKAWFNPQTGKTSVDGKYIDDVHGEYLKRDWMDVAMDVLIMIARVLSPVRWLHNLGAIDLGKSAAKWLSGIVMAVWGLVLTIGFVQSARNLIDEVNLELIQKRIGDAISSLLDLISIPFDFGVGSAHPVLAFVGAFLNIASAAVLLIKEGIYYNS